MLDFLVLLLLCLLLWLGYNIKVELEIDSDVKTTLIAHVITQLSGVGMAEEALKQLF